AGRDTLLGDQGSDRLFGGGQADDLSGGSGKDTLNGGSGADSLGGEDGNDRLLGGGGGDVFVIIGSGRDTISDFGDLDQVDLTAFGFQNFGEVEQFVSDQGANMVFKVADMEVVFLGFSTAQFSSNDVIL